VLKIVVVRGKVVIQSRYFSIGPEGFLIMREGKRMCDQSKFTTTAAKTLPICLLLETSGSMSGHKIAALNQAVRKMLRTFAKEEQMETEIVVSIITNKQVSPRLCRGDSRRFDRALQ
jgi:hypothetical protein